MKQNGSYRGNNGSVNSSMTASMSVTLNLLERQDSERPDVGYHGEFIAVMRR